MPKPVPSIFFHEICHSGQERDENQCPLTVMAVLGILGGFHYEIVQDAPNGEEGHKQDSIQEQYRFHVRTEVCCIRLEARFYSMRPDEDNPEKRRA